MSASPSAVATPATNTKRPLDDESSPSGPTDQPDAKRPALDKAAKAEEGAGENRIVEPVLATEEAPPDQEPVAGGVKTEPGSTPLENGHTDTQGDTVVPDAPNGAVPSAAAVLPRWSSARRRDSLA